MIMRSGGAVEVVLKLIGGFSEFPDSLVKGVRSNMVSSKKVSMLSLKWAKVDGYLIGVIRSLMR